jgi:hypothetical protein
VEVAGGDIVEARVAEHVLAGPLRRDVVTALLDDDGELTLVVDAARLGREDDGVVRPAQGRDRLEEELGLRRDLHVHLLGVLAIVEAHPHDLRGHHRGQQHRLAQQVLLPSLLEAAVGRPRVLDDVLALEHAVAGLAAGPEAHDPHVSPSTSCIE